MRHSRNLSGARLVSSRSRWRRPGPPGMFPGELCRRTRCGVGHSAVREFAQPAKTFMGSGADKQKNNLRYLVSFCEKKAGSALSFTEGNQGNEVIQRRAGVHPPQYCYGGRVSPASADQAGHGRLFVTADRRDALSYLVSWLNCSFSHDANQRDPRGQSCRAKVRRQKTTLQPI